MRQSLETLFAAMNDERGCAMLLPPIKRERSTWISLESVITLLNTFFWPHQSILFFSSQLSVQGGNLTWGRLSIYPASKSSSKASGPSGSGIVYPMVTAPVSDNHSESEISHGGWELERQPLVFFLTPKQSLASRAEAVVVNALEIGSFLWHQINKCERCFTAEKLHI